MAALETMERPDTTSSQPQRWSGYGTTVLGAVLLVLGGLWMLDLLAVIELRAAIILPVLLGIVGLALILGAWDGPHSGLVVAGVFLSVAVLAAAVTPPNAFAGGIGERTYTVIDQGDLAARYDVGVGDLRLDLRQLELTESAFVDVSVGTGRMLLTLPPDLAVDITASVGAGDIDLIGERSDGLSVTRTYTSSNIGGAEVVLTLDLNVVAGEIEVTR